MKTVDVVLAVMIAIFLAGATAYAGEDVQASPIAASQSN